jgi:L-malate glycosyltransferase
LLFGKGSQEAKIRVLFEKAGIADKVYFGGYAALEELPDIYRSADYYVSASHSDGSSVSLMEALACGIPAIVSDIPSNREWIREGDCGWCFKDGSSVDLSSRMLAASRYENREEMAERCRDLAETRADWKINFSKLLDAYTEAVRLAGNK